LRLLTLLRRDPVAVSEAGDIEIGTVIAATTPAGAVAVMVNRDIPAAEVRSVPQPIS
jgi:hypothetical protein